MKNVQYSSYVNAIDQFFKGLKGTEQLQNYNEFMQKLNNYVSKYLRKHIVRFQRNNDSLLCMVNKDKTSLEFSVIM